MKRGPIRSSFGWAGWCAWAGCVLWLVGRVVNDRFLWSQFVFWIPGWIAVGLSVAAVLLRRLCDAGAQRPGTRRRWFVLVPAACAVFAVWEWRVWNIVRAAPTGGAVRIVAWNPATDFMDDFAQRVSGLAPAIVAIANRPAHTKWDVIKSAVGGSGDMVRDGRLSLVSRFPVVRWGFSPLNITGSRPQLSTWRGGSLVSIDRGEALFAELDTTAIWGRSTVIWLVDLPSDPLIPRWRMFGQAAATLSAYRGPVYRADGERESIDGFPPPDIVLGDFNTPRGSESIRRLVGDLGDAHARAGVGPAPSWPRRRPVLGINHTFVRRPLSVLRYRVVDMGAGQHLAQITDLADR